MKCDAENVSAITVVHTSVRMTLTFVPHYCSDIQSLHSTYRVCVNNLNDVTPCHHSSERTNFGASILVVSECIMDVHVAANGIS